MGLSLHWVFCCCMRKSITQIWRQSVTYYRMLKIFLKEWNEIELFKVTSHHIRKRETLNKLILSRFLIRSIHYSKCFRQQNKVYKNTLFFENLMGITINWKIKDVSKILFPNFTFDVRECNFDWTLKI